MALFPIKILLTPSLLAPVEKWAAKFNHSSLNRFSDAVVVGNKLVIDAMHVGEFLRMANESESSQLDVRRLKTEAIQQITASLKRRKSQFSVGGLQRVLEDLEGVQVGEWKDVDFNEPEPEKPLKRFSYVGGAPLELVR